MTPQIIVLIFWVAVVFVVWRLFRSKFYREACEDIDAMNKAPEYKGRSKEFQPHMANPLYQITHDKENETSSKHEPHDS
jgi:hypothetical protein